MLSNLRIWLSSRASFKADSKDASQFDFATNTSKLRQITSMVPFLKHSFFLEFRRTSFSFLRQMFLCNFRGSGVPIDLERAGYYGAGFIVPYRFREARLSRNEGGMALNVGNGLPTSLPSENTQGYSPRAHLFP